MKITYKGPASAVEIVGGYRAERGVSVDLPAALAKSLLEQDTFEKSTADPAAEVSEGDK